MSSPLKQLSLTCLLTTTCLLTLSSFSLMANPNKGQTGKTEYVFCPEAPDCDTDYPPMANLKSPQNNN